MGREGSTIQKLELIIKLSPYFPIGSLRDASSISTAQLRRYHYKSLNINVPELFGTKLRKKTKRMLSK